LGRIFGEFLSICTENDGQSFFTRLLEIAGFILMIILLPVADNQLLLIVLFLI